VKTMILGLLAETSLHPGTEQSTGAVDLPVAREASTDYPVIAGSGLKGSLRDAARQRGMEKENREDVFGTRNGAGGVSVTDARLLLLPVRSLTGHFKLVTCPYILQRFKRDMILAGRTVSFEIPEPKKEYAVASEDADNLFLEEISFKVQKKDLTGLAKDIEPLVRHPETRKRLGGQITVLTDDEFSYFANYGLQVNARNILDKDKKTSKNLWYEETLPPDSLFYSLILPRPGKENALDSIKKLFAERPYLQVGGNETVGQGWCAVTCVEEVGAGV